MERETKGSCESQTEPPKYSPVKAMIEWLIETDREFRVAQSIVNETHDKYQK